MLVAVKTKCLPMTRKLYKIDCDVRSDGGRQEDSSSLEVKVKTNVQLANEQRQG